MSLASHLKVSKQPLLPSIALLALRVVVGLAFMRHGWGKIQHPFNWMGDSATTPGILQALAALSEFGGGFGFIVGLFVPLAAFGIACTMGFAVFTHMIIKGDPFMAMGGSSYELAAVYFCVALVLLTLGPGKISADRIVFGDH